MLPICHQKLREHAIQTHVADASRRHLIQYNSFNAINNTQIAVTSKIIPEV
jgi:hypothetical protein